MGTEFRVVISAYRVDGRVSREGGDFTALTGGKVVRDHLKTIEVLEKWLKRWQLLTALDEQVPPFREGQNLIVPETIQLLGSYLWKMVLEGNGIGSEILAELFKTQAHQPNSIRVRISFKDASELALLPWEFLQIPGDVGRNEFWLASELRLVLGRFVEGHRDINIDLADEKLRVLFVRHLPIEEHYNPQRDACDDLVATLVNRRTTRDRVDAKVVERWSGEKVREAMQSFRSAGHRVDVVHLTALFRIENGVCQVKLSTAQVRGGWTNADTLVENVCADESNRPSLVILHLIDQADGDFMQHSEQLAPAFIVGGVPAVLAMQYPMTTEEAHQFLTYFYQALADGRPIGAAVQMSRNKLKLLGTSRHFGSPVLYMQSSADGNLIEARKDEPRSSPPPTERQVVTVARSSHDRSKASVQTRLLQVLDSIDLAPAAVMTLRSEIRQLTWPDDEKAAREQVRQMLRGRQDDPVWGRAFERMLNEITGPARARS